MNYSFKNKSYTDTYLRDQNQDLRQALQLQQDLIYTTAHDIKNSLLVLGLTIDLIKRAGETSVTEKLLKTLKSSHKEMKRSVQELLINMRHII